MKKILLSGILLVGTLSAKELISQINPTNTFYIQSEVSGIVSKSFLNKEKNFIKERTKIIQIDTYKEEIELKKILTKITLLKQLIKNSENILEGILKSESKSKSNKLKEKNNLLNLNMNLADLKERKSLLEEIIKRKTIEIEDLYINDIYINKNEYVTPGTKLMKVSNIKEKEIKFYLTKEELEKIEKEKYVLLNENKKNITKQWKVKSIDLIKSETFLSGYEIVLKTEEEVKLSTFITLSI